jgi:hypothetical protein
MAKKVKEATITDFHRAFLVQLERDLNQFIGNCQSLDSEDIGAFESLKGFATEFVEDVEHYIKNYKITDCIVNVDVNGKPALRGNQSYVKEQQFFLAHAKQTDPKKSRPFISYKEFVKKVRAENTRRSKNGEELLIDIAEITYTSWKSKYK